MRKFLIIALGVASVGAAFAPPAFGETNNFSSICHCSSNKTACRSVCFIRNQARMHVKAEEDARTRITAFDTD